jgi:hypothetical protein
LAATSGQKIFGSLASIGVDANTKAASAVVASPEAALSMPTKREPGTIFMRALK